MKKALLVGIDNYGGCILNSCKGLVDRLNDLISFNEDLLQSYNFHSKLLLSTDDSESVSVEKATLAKINLQLRQLFAGEGEIALLYFVGLAKLSKENSIELMTYDGIPGRWGVSLEEIIRQANGATGWNEVVIILDCWFNDQEIPRFSISGYNELRTGVSILCSIMKDEVSSKMSKHGIFSKALIDGLEGCAADILGKVTVSSLYNYIDQVLSPWYHRPIFISHINRIKPIRLVKPKISINDLRKLTSLFIEANHEFKLKPDFEITHENFDPEKGEIFRVLQKYNQAGLVEPKDEEFMYYAAMNSKSCYLSGQGKAYWNMVNEGLI